MTLTSVSPTVIVAFGGWLGPRVMHGMQDAMASRVASPSFSTEMAGQRRATSWLVLRVMYRQCSPPCFLQCSTTWHALPYLEHASWTSSMSHCDTPCQLSDMKVKLPVSLTKESTSLMTRSSRPKSQTSRHCHATLLVLLSRTHSSPSLERSRRTSLEYSDMSNMLKICQILTWEPAYPQIQILEMR